MDWKQIKAEYIAGGTSYRKLCDKYGVALTTLQRIAKREDWTGLRQRAVDKADAKLTDEIGRRNAERSVKIIDVADKLLEKISETIDKMDTIDSQSLKHFTSALKDIKDIKGFKSDLDLREQEARIAKLQREAEADSDGAEEIKVVIVGDAEAYSK